MTFIVLVDGLHHLQHEPGSKTSILYQVLCTLADLSNRSGGINTPWLIACFGGTLHQPMSEWFSSSRQIKCYLYPPNINGNTILIPQNVKEEFFIEDMGGNGAALECLEAELPNY